MTGDEKIEYASLTDVGVRRSHNQDNHAVLLARDEEQRRKSGHVFLVADGMGAHAVGELASELAASIIPHTYHKYAEEGAAPALQKAFLEANASIHARGQQNKEFQGMGTTSTAVVLRRDGAWIAHVGDSRAYRIRAGRIEQLSFDHSLAWELARRQGVSPDGLEGIPSNVIVRSLGPEPEVQVDIEGPHPVQDGDIYVLCSDGLSNPISDHEIGAVATVLPPDEACQFLIHLANLRGGPDNITVIIAHVGGVRELSGIRLGQGTAPAGSRFRIPILGLMPWPFYLLLLGVVLAGLAAFLTASRIEGGVTAFILAATAIFIGLGGLAVLHFREQHTRRLRTSREP